MGVGSDKEKEVEKNTFRKFQLTDIALLFSN